MRLTILSVGYPLAAVGPNAVGGAEQILTRLDAEIEAVGHTSIVVAPEGSTTKGVLIPLGEPEGPLDDAVRQEVQLETRRAINQALAQYPVDVVHMHGLDFDAYLPPPGCPVLATLHLPPYQYAARVWNLRRPLTFLHGVSGTQHRAMPSTSVPLLEPIANGVPLDLLGPSTCKDDFALVIGRVCPEKGFHLAAEAARRAGAKMVLAGAVFPFAEHQCYFKTTLQPLIARGAIEFVGALGLQEKRALLARARCLLVPSQIPETSSLVAMEALACGTPVVAFRAGALPEIVEDGRTGFLVDSVQQMAEAMTRLDEIDPADCRRAAEERFSAARMAAEYLERYERIARPAHVSSHSLHVDEVTSTGALESVRGEWAEVWRRSRTPSVFQHPDWLIPWCRPFGVTHPWVLLIRRGGRLVGVAPFVVYPRNQERVLTLLGAGVSDDQGILAEAGQETLVLESVWQYLATHADAFDVCELENVPEGSMLLGATPAGWQTMCTQRQDVRPVLRLTTYEEVVPAGMRKRLRYSYNRLRREIGQPRCEAVTVANFDRLFDGLVALHRARWIARRQSGVLPPHLEQFHREAARRLLASDLLRLHALYVGERLAAVFYGYEAGGRTVYYLSGFDPELERYSPGNLVVAHAIEYAIRHDHARAFDFLRGAEPYKYAWGAVDEPLFRKCLRPVTPGVAHAA